MNPRQKRALELLERGYRPIPIEAGQKRPLFAGWPSYKATPELIAEWPAKGGIGILTADTPAVDLDIRDAEVAREMEAWIVSRFGDAPVRVGRAPKRLMVFAAGESFRKLASARFECELGDTHQVEILGHGQQFVAFGVHPDTGKPYQWVSGQALHEIDVFDLPTLTVEKAREIIAEFERLARERGWTPKTEAREAGADDDLDFLRPKPDISDDEVRKAIELLDNPGRDYDLWLKVGAALHSHFDGSNDGLLLWHEWSERSPLYNDAETDRRYKSFGKYTGRGTTAAFLLHATKEKRAALAVVERKSAFQSVTEAIEAATELDALMGDLARQVREAEVEDYHRETLVNALHAKAKKLGHKLSIKVVRDAVAGKSGAKAAAPTTLSLERDLAQQVLDAHFAGGEHLKRFSKMWWSYRGGRWTRADDEVVEKAVMDTLLALDPFDEAVAFLTAQVGESRGDRLSALVSTVTKALGLLVAEEGGDDPLNLLSFDVPRVMNFRNGELWFDEHGNTTFKRHDPKNNLTFRLECDYDPSATAPTWEAALARVTRQCADPAGVAGLIHEVYGYIAQPTRDAATWVLFKGPGGNGKSFIADVMATLMGRDTVLARSIAEIASGAGAHFGDSLVGKNMLLDDDYKAGALLPDDWLKKLSEAKLVTANPKFARTFEFKARAIPVILANHWPSTTDLSEGLRRRAVVIETNYILRNEEKDPSHKSRIVRHELSGVANLLIAGFVRFLRRGSRFQMPAECEASKQVWLQSSNLTALFVGTVLTKVETAKGQARPKIAGEVLYDLYRQWLRTNEHNAKELGRSKFYDAIEKLGVDRAYPGNKCHFYGIRVNSGIEGIEFFDDL